MTNPADALAVGWVDTLVDREAVLDRAIEEMKKYLAVSQPARTLAKMHANEVRVCEIASIGEMYTYMPSTKCCRHTMTNKIPH